MKKIEYFGTSKREKGHFMWEFTEKSMVFNKLNMEHLPFYPENYPKNDYEKGNVEFHHVDGYSIIAIAGSPADKRPGSKMVFFVNEIINAQDLLDRMNKNPLIVEILDSLPFFVHYKRIVRDY